MNASPYGDADTDVNKIDPGKYVATFAGPKRHNSKDGKIIQLILSYKFGPNQGKNSGKSKDEFFQVSHATPGNRDWALKRFVESFKFTKEDVVNATAGTAGNPGAEVEGLIKLLSQRTGRKVVVDIKVNGNYMNIVGGGLGVRPLTAEEEANGLGDYVEDLTEAPAGSQDPWSDTATDGKSVDDILGELPDTDDELSNI